MYIAFNIYIDILLKALYMNDKYRYILIILIIFSSWEEVNFLTDNERKIHSSIVRPKKQSLVENLRDADGQLMQSPSLLGMTMLTWPNYINAMRSTMFTSHIKQFVNLVNSDVPYIFTNNENIVGDRSSGYNKTKHKYKVYKKIVKYEDLIDEPNVYYLIYFDEVEKKFDVIERQPCEELVENFGYAFDNTVIDSYEEGDEIEAGTVLFNSTSYDENMCYGYGKNVTVAYTLDPATSEDAAVASRSLCDQFTSIETETIGIGLNDNQFLLNIYGDSDNYIGLPKIGQEISDILCITRNKFNNQVLFDFKDTSLREIHDDDNIYYINGKSTIIDYDIYVNNDKMMDSPFYNQIRTLYKSQTKFYKEVYEVCKYIEDSCDSSGGEYTYSHNLDYLLKRSAEVIDTNKKWRDGKGNTFSNIEIHVRYMKKTPLAKGSKITGRFGNKSVVSEIREDEDMPFTEDGRRVDLLLNLLAIINRTTSFLLFELFITGSAYKVRKRLSELKTLKEKETELFDFIRILNEHQADDFYSKYKKLSTSEKKDFIQDAIDNGIYIHQQPMWETKAIFYRCEDLRRRFDYLKEDKVYIRKFGRIYPVLSNYYIGDMYIMKLKHSDKRGFSARSTGALDTKSLPTRSFKSKSHLERISTSCIRFGEFETLNFSIGIIPEDIVLFHALYRTSVKGRKDLVNLMFSDESDGIKVIDKSYTNRVAEVFNVTLKALGIEVQFVDDDNVIRAFNNDTLTTHELNGNIYFCSDYQFFLLKRESEIRAEILSQNPVMLENELNALVKRTLKERKYLIGNYEDTMGDLSLDVEKENQIIHDELVKRQLEKDTADVAETLDIVEKSN